MISFLCLNFEWAANRLNRNASFLGEFTLDCGKSGLNTRPYPIMLDLFCISFLALD